MFAAIFSDFLVTARQQIKFPETFLGNSAGQDAKTVWHTGEATPLKLLPRGLEDKADFLGKLFWDEAEASIFND